MKNLICIASAAALLCGCAHIQPMQSQLDESKFAEFSTNGSAILTGQAFMKTRGGDVRYAAGSNVELIPSTPYSDEWATRKFFTHVRIGPMDARVDKYIRKTVADATGSFEFDDLPAGWYWVTAWVVWQVGDPQWDSFGVNQQGGEMCQRIQIENGEKKKFVLTY